MKRWTSFTICFLMIALVKGQNTTPEFSIKDRFISSAGISMVRINQNKQNEELYGLCFSPSLNLLNKYSDFSVSFASHLMAAYHPESSTDSQTYFMYSFPALLRFNGGHLATRDFYSAFGISVGGGYNFTIVNSQFRMGPLLITAIRFWFLRQSFTVGYAQTYLQNPSTLMHEVSLQLNIGAYLRDVKSNNKISRFVKPFRKS